MEQTRRRWENVLIGIFLAYQVLTPLTYYLGDGGYDERFSWRMFSTTRLARCNIAMTEAPEGGAHRPVDLARTLQIAWVNMLKRYRPAVVHAAMDARCGGEGEVAEVRFERSCVDTDGSTLPRQTLTLSCADGAFTEPEAAP